jgi:two-component system cell cycle sensor histidine kinase/response regulator CckA
MNIEKRSPLVIAAIYFLAGAAWTFITDRLLPHLALTPREMADWRICNGWLYVGVTSVLIYWFLRLYGRMLLRSRDEAVENLRRSESSLKSVVESLPFEFWVSDRDGLCIMQNSLSIRNLGNCVGNRLEQKRQPADFADRLRHKVLTGEVVTNETSYDLNGTRSYRYEIMSPVRDDETIWGATGISIDITQLKRAEEALLDSELRYSRLFEDAVLGIFQFSPEGRINSVNPALAGMFGYASSAELLSSVSNSAHLYAAPRRQNWVVSLILEDAECVRIENGFRRKDGSIFVGNLSVWKVRDRNGNIVCLEGFIEDISEQKRAEEAIRESEEKFRTIFENAPVMISSFDDSEKCLLWNRECEKNLGWTREEVCESADPLILFFPDQEQKNRVMANILRADGNFTESRVLARDGGERTQLWANFRLPNGSVISVGHDITSRKKAVIDLQRERAFLRSLIGSIPDLIFYKDKSSTYLGCNRAFEEFAGKRETEIIGKTDLDLFPVDMAGLFRTMDSMMLDSGTARRNEEWVVYPDGRRFLLDTLKTPFFDEQGNTLGIIGISRDITDHRRAEDERNKLEAQLFHAQKMEAVGLLAGGVAHDFNNILTAIKGYAYLLRSKIEEVQMLHFLEQLDRAADKATSLTNSLLAFSRKRVISLKPVEVSEAIGRSVKLLARLINEDIEIRSSMSGDSLTILGDESHIDQVVMNLATNARDAMPKGGTLTISTERFVMSMNFVEEHGFGRAGEYALIKFCDTGTGIDEEHRAHLFEPFFTTKEVGKGTGLGLSIIYGIVKQHEGYIDMESEPGKGTTFSIYLPLIKEKMKEIERKPEPRPKSGTETILIGEDDSNVRELTRCLLEEFGYRVLEAVDGFDTVEKFRSNRDKIQLVILDVIMPRKNGRDVYEEITRIKPGVKTIFLSGYASDILTSKGIFQDGLNFLIKPVLPGVFLNKVREVLGK